MAGAKKKFFKISLNMLYVQVLSKYYMQPGSHIQFPAAYFLIVITLCCYSIRKLVIYPADLNHPGYIELGT